MDTFRFLKMALNTSPRGDELLDYVDKSGKTKKVSNIIGKVSRIQIIEMFIKMAMMMRANP